MRVSIKPCSPANHHINAHSSGILDRRSKFDVSRAVAYSRSRKRNPAATIRFEDLNKALRLEIVPVSVEMAYVARVAHRDYGRGSHPAKLNYGDCFSYALSKHLQEPLLFKGNDFSQTDIVPALKD